MSTLPHADHIEALLRQGKRAEARRAHNRRVAEQLAAAEAGTVINLSDLIAGAEAFVVDDIERGRS